MLITALSIRQPWAWLICRPDLTDADERAHAVRVGILKDIENRSWHTNFRGGFLVHASTGMTLDEMVDALLFAKRALGDLAIPDVRCPAPGRSALRPTAGDPTAQISLTRDSFDRGGLVGYAEVTGCVVDSASRWFMGDFGFKLEAQRPLPFLPCKGALGFFKLDVPDAYVAANLPEFWRVAA